MADIIAALWDASFMGVPFYVERDDLKGGRRLVVNEFPYSDEPYIEDLGRRATHFSVTAYVTSDDYVAQSEALIGVLDAGGVGTLVLPTVGPVPARCKSFERSRNKDRIGYNAFSCEFVREGTASALGQGAPSAAYLLQRTIDAADAAQAEAAGLARRLRLAGQPAWIVDAASAGLQDAIAGLDVIRAETPIDPLASFKLAATLAGLYNAVPSAVRSDGPNATGALATIVAAPLVATARALAAALPAATAAAAFQAAIDEAALDEALPLAASPRTLTPLRATAAGNASLAARLSRLALVTAYVESLVRAAYDSRPEGVAARAALVARLGAEMDLCRGAEDEALFLALVGLRAAAVAALSQIITTLAPVVVVTNNIALPSLVLAWTLYRDPLRARELVTRNAVRHPSYMPTRIEVLAPSPALASRAMARGG